MIHISKIINKMQLFTKCPQCKDDAFLYCREGKYWLDCIGCGYKITLAWFNNKRKYEKIQH